jgi:hypothetical protein
MRTGKRAERVHPVQGAVNRWEASGDSQSAVGTARAGAQSGISAAQGRLILREDAAPHPIEAPRGVRHQVDLDVHAGLDVFERLPNRYSTPTALSMTMAIEVTP